MSGDAEHTAENDAALVERACEVMHDAYEAAAVTAGWETQQQSRKPWADVPEANKATMRAAVSALINWLPATRVIPPGSGDQGMSTDAEHTARCSRCDEVVGTTVIEGGRATIRLSTSSHGDTLPITCPHAATEQPWEWHPDGPEAHAMLEQIQAAAPSSDNHLEEQA